MRKIIPAVAAGVTALAVAGGTFGYVTLDKAVALSIDGDVSQVQTMEPTVGELLEKQGIQVGEHDVVVPAADTRLAEGTAIAVNYGRLVTITVDGAEQQIWTTATSVDRAIDELGIDTTGADVDPALATAVGRDGLAVDIATAKTVTIVAAGKKRNVTTTAQTVAGALTAAKIKVDGNDKLSVRPTAKLVDGTSVRYIRVTESKLTEKVSLAYKTVRKETDEARQGRHQGRHQGRQGRPHPHLQGGPARRQDRQQEADQRQGDQEAGDPGGAGRHQGRSRSRVGARRRQSTPSASVASGSVWDRLAQCESGGNWSINTGNGYYGGLQFSLSTWRAYGGSGYPHQNSRAQQIAIGQKLQAAAGWGQWPACSAKLGLR